MRRLTAAALTLAALVVTAAAPAQYYGLFGGGESKVTFALCINEPCAVGTNITNRYIVTKKASFKKCYITAKSAPSGANLILDINVNGSSIFSGVPSQKLNLDDGETGPQSTTSFDNPNVLENDVVTVDIDQVGTLAAGQDVTAVCRF